MRGLRPAPHIIERIYYPEERSAVLPAWLPARRDGKTRKRKINSLEIDYSVSEGQYMSNLLTPPEQLSVKALPAGRQGLRRLLTEALSARVCGQHYYFSKRSCP